MLTSVAEQAEPIPICGDNDYVLAKQKIRAAMHECPPGKRVVMILDYEDDPSFENAQLAAAETVS